MIGLLWKEYREKRIWALPLLVVAFGLMLAAVTLGAVLYRFTCPAPYMEFATPARLAAGIGYGVFSIGVVYLVGLACSVALPGMVGGILTVVIAAILAGIELQIVSELNSELAGLNSEPDWMFVAWPIGLAIAALVTMRFGLTLRTAARAGRYALVAALVVVCVSAAGFVRNGGYFESPYAPVVDWCYAGPGAKYAIMQEGRLLPPRVGNAPKPSHSQYETTLFLARLGDGKRARLPYTVFSASNVWRELVWVGSDMVYPENAREFAGPKDYDVIRTFEWSVPAVFFRKQLDSTSTIQKTFAR